MAAIHHNNKKYSARLVSFLKYIFLTKKKKKILKFLFENLQMFIYV